MIKGLIIPYYIEPVPTPIVGVRTGFNIYTSHLYFCLHP